MSLGGAPQHRGQGVDGACARQGPLPTGRRHSPQHQQNLSSSSSSKRQGRPAISDHPGLVPQPMRVATPPPHPIHPPTRTAPALPAAALVTTLRTLSVLAAAASSDMVVGFCVHAASTNDNGTPPKRRDTLAWRMLARLATLAKSAPSGVSSAPMLGLKLRAARESTAASGATSMGASDRGTRSAPDPPTASSGAPAGMPTAVGVSFAPGAGVRGEAVVPACGPSLGCVGSVSASMLGVGAQRCGPAVWPRGRVTVLLG